MEKQNLRIINQVYNIISPFLCVLMANPELKLGHLCIHCRVPSQKEIQCLLEKAQKLYHKAWAFLVKALHNILAEYSKTKKHCFMGHPVVVLGRALYGRRKCLHLPSPAQPSPAQPSPGHGELFYVRSVGYTGLCCSQPSPAQQGY